MIIKPKKHVVFDIVKDKIPYGAVELLLGNIEISNKIKYVFRENKFVELRIGLIVDVEYTFCVTTKVYKFFDKEIKEKVTDSILIFLSEDDFVEYAEFRGVVYECASQ